VPSFTRSGTSPYSAHCPGRSASNGPDRSGGHDCTGRPSNSSVCSGRSSDSYKCPGGPSDSYKCAGSPSDSYKCAGRSSDSYNCSGGASDSPYCGNSGPYRGTNRCTYWRTNQRTYKLPDGSGNRRPCCWDCRPHQRAGDARSDTPGDERRTQLLSVGGPLCAACPRDVRRAKRRVPGVRERQLRRRAGDAVPDVRRARGAVADGDDLQRHDHLHRAQLVRLRAVRRPAHELHRVPAGVHRSLVRPLDLLR
jgi:hypothetical protein